MSDLLGDKKVYVGKFSKEIIEKAERLGFKRDTEDLDRMPFLIFSSTFKTIRSLFHVDTFNNHSYKEVTPEWILNLPDKVDKSWKRLGSQITGFQVFEKEIMPINIRDINFSEKLEEFDVYNVLPSREEAEAYRILPKLLYWRDFYNEDWKPDWNSRGEWKHCIYFYDGKISDTACLAPKHTFAFKSKEIMGKFLKDFKEELEIVKPFL